MHLCSSFHPEISKHFSNIGWMKPHRALTEEIRNYCSQFINWEMFAEEDQGILSGGKGWECGNAVAESGSCCRNYSPSEGLHQFKHVLSGTKVAAGNDGLNLGQVITSHQLPLYCRGWQWMRVTYSYRSAPILYDLNKGQISSELRAK